jgi:flavin reductase (DIM6/NTAB) family NADH-FMN oxidoreductase RutF
MPLSPHAAKPERAVPTSSSGSLPPLPRPDFTEREFRDTLAAFVTGVTVICAAGPPGKYAGFTANSFNSVSLDPPLVLWSLDWRAQTLPFFEQAERYTVNILAHDQVALAERFSQPHEDRFAGVEYRLGAAGAPLIGGCVGWLECRRHTQVRVGDHVLFIGHVETCARGHGQALVFHHGRFTTTREIGASESS